MPGKNLLGACQGPYDIVLPPFDRMQIDASVSGENVVEQQVFDEVFCTRTTRSTISGSFTDLINRISLKQFVDQDSQLNDNEFVYYGDSCCSKGRGLLSRGGGNELGNNGTWVRTCETDCPHPSVCDGIPFNYSDLVFVAGASVGFVPPEYTTFQISGFFGLYFDFPSTAIFSLSFLTDEIPISDLLIPHSIDIIGEGGYAGWVGNVTVTLFKSP